MAEPDTEPVAAEPARGGFFSRFVAGIKRIKPGEWALIGIGLVGIIVYIIWYRRQQASSSGYNALVPGGGTSNPNWGTAQAQPGGTFDSEIAALLTQLASNGAATTPNTTVTSAGGGVSGGAGGVGGIAGGAQGSGLPLTGQPATIVGAPASSGSGITQQPNNQAPVQNTTALVQGTGPVMLAPAAAPANNPVGLTARTGLIGVPQASGVRVPPNVTPPLSPAGGSNTVASRQAPPAPVYHVNVVQPYVTHSTAPVPAPVAPTKAPVGGTSRPMR